MSDRRVNGFFYGLFMDVNVLRESNVTPVDLCRAYVDDYALRIGQRATLLPSVGARAYGMFMTLNFTDLERLYSAPGLDQYRPEAVLVRPLDGQPMAAALCYNLRDAPRPDEKNPAYALRLQRVLRDLEFPSEYVDTVT